MLTRKIYYIIVFLLLINIPVFANGFNRVANIYGGFRPYGFLGNTSVDTDTDSGLSYGGGAQLFFGGINQLLYGTIGLDAGFVHLYDYKEDGKTRRADYIDCLLIAEGTFFFFTIQAGAGKFFGVGDADGNEWGYMLSPGFNLPVDKGVSIPLLCRMLWVDTEEKSFSIGFFTGLTVFF